MKPLLKTIIIAIVCLVIGFVLGMEYKAYQIRAALKEGLSEISEAFSGGGKTSDSNAEPVEEVVIEKKISEEVELATMKFKINSSEETKILSAKYSQPTTAKAGAKFVVVDLDITNTTKAPFTFFDSDSFAIADEQERAFTPYSSIGKIDNYFSGRNLAPNITENGKIVFELPEDSTKYGITIGKAGTNEIYVVTLN